ncbi:MAG: FAD-dependent oxidoreductase, partial [Pseudomonadota bacterium]
MDATSPTDRKVAVIGAGIGGLSAALILAHRGFDVTIYEARSTPGGKIRQETAGGPPTDCGPTVFTMDWAFRAIFEAADETLEEHLTIDRADLLARHAWPDGSRLDLFCDLDRSAEAVRKLAGEQDARAFRAFSSRSQRIFDVLSPKFLKRQRPGFWSMAGRVGPNVRLGLDMAPHLTLAQLLRRTFRDPRLRQLFGRYATYVGGSPYLTPAMMMLIWHAERTGVWTVRGGMYEIVRQLTSLIENRGGRVRCGEPVSQILEKDGAVTGVHLKSGEDAPADIVVYNGDVAALAAGLLPSPNVPRPTPPSDRSLSALTAVVYATVEGFP